MRRARTTSSTFRFPDWPLREGCSGTVTSIASYYAEVSPDDAPGVLGVSGREKGPEPLAGAGQGADGGEPLLLPPLVAAVAWREAPPHSPERRKANDHDRALDMLAFWLRLSGASPED